MKDKIRRNEKICVYLELNQKFGYGYQGRLVFGVGKDIVNSVIDDQPYEFAEAYKGMYDALEEIKSREKYTYDTHKIIHISKEAIEANKKRDFTSAQIAADIENGKGEICIPLADDYRKETIDGEEKILFSARGVLLTALFSWRDDGTPKAKESLKKYCEYLAMRRYNGTASEIFKELAGMDKDKAADWIKATHGKYVKNDTDLINYIFSL